MTTWYPNSATPFPELAGMAAAYFNPETHDVNDIEELREAVQEEPPSEWIVEVKSQLIQVLEQHLEGMNVAEFDREVKVSARSTEIFIRRMWATIFPDEPIPGGPSDPWDTTYTLIDIYFDERDPDDNLVHPDHLARQLQRPEDEQTPLLQSIKPELTRMLQGDFEGLDLQEFRTRASSYYFHLNRDYKDFARHVWRYLFPDEPMPEA